MKPSISYLLGLDPERIRKEAPTVGVRILEERPVHFINAGPMPRFAVQAGDEQGYLIPISPAVRENRMRSGQHIPVYTWEEM